MHTKPSGRSARQRLSLPDRCRSRRGRQESLSSWRLALRLADPGLAPDFLGAWKLLEYCRRPAVGRRKAQQLAHSNRPPGDVFAMGMELRDGETVHSEGHAGGVGRLGVRIDDTPCGAEMIPVVVEA